MTPSSSQGENIGSEAIFARRLVAVAFADIVGYSTLMAEDEDRTHARWMSIRREIIEPRLRAHRGHLVKSTGDGVLVEFASVLDAVAWGREVQESIREAIAAAEGSERHLELRIAVHLCDVIEEETDIYGDGVNIAARLQEFAPPGGVIVSETVYEIARVSIDLEAKSLGYLKLKNMATAVRAYLIDSSQSESVELLQTRNKIRPSIAVLPLQNLSADPRDSYFGDGIVEDIVVSLASLRELLVISRASTLVYGARQPDPRDVGRTLGVRYVLMGAFRRSAGKVRVSIELCNADGGACLWADSYVVPLGDLFEVQDEIVSRVVAGIAPNVRAVELREAMRKRPENFSAYDHTLRALECIHSLDRETFMRARDLLTQAITLDPEFAMSVAWMARWYSLLVGQGWTEQRDQDAAEGLRFASKAIELDPQNALALATFGHMRSYLFHDYDSAAVYLDRARSACPNSAPAWVLSSATMSYIGKSKEAVRYAERGLRLSPYDRSLFYSYFFLGLAHYGAGAYDQAIKWCRLSLSENAFYTATYRILSAAMVGAGAVEQGKEIAQALLRLEPDFSVEHYARTRQPFRDEQTRKTYLDQLRSAGIPD